jgi:hypothetical protein
MPGAPARAHWSGGWRPGLHGLPCVCRRCRLRLTGGSGGGARRLCGRRQVAAGAREPLDLPRVQLHDPPGVRLFGAQPPLQVHPAARRLRPVGQHGAFVCLPPFRASVSLFPVQLSVSSAPLCCVGCCCMCWVNQGQRRDANVPRARAGERRGALQASRPAASVCPHRSPHHHSRRQEDGQVGGRSVCPPRASPRAPTASAHKPAG